MIHVAIQSLPQTCSAEIVRTYHDGLLVGLRVTITDVFARHGDVWALLAELTAEGGRME